MERLRKANQKIRGRGTFESRLGKAWVEIIPLSAQEFPAGGVREDFENLCARIESYHVGHDPNTGVPTFSEVSEEDRTLIINGLQSLFDDANRLGLR